MGVHECRKCGVLITSNGSPDECPACGNGKRRAGGGNRGFYRYDDPAELFG